MFHLSFYRFFPLGDDAALRALREDLRARCTELKGTILLAREGVNVMLSGTESEITRFKDFAATHWGVTAFKLHETQEPPFERMLIKIKKEIIPVGDPELRPDLETAPRLSPQQLKQWLDEKKPVVLLDTRNDYEVEVGTFEGAEHLGLTNSREFTEKAAFNKDKWAQTPVVTFCTGGIRCEKASAVLLKLGLRDVYQLDGGILNYLEQNGSQHFNGNCFVFDWRLAVDGELKPAPRSTLEPAKQFGRHRT